MINATVTGNLGKDAELRDTNSGPVLSFNVASSRKVKGEDQTTWVRCSLFGKRGEALAQYLTKGSKVAVSGDLSTRDYQGKTYVEMRVSELDLMGGRRNADPYDRGGSSVPASPPQDDGPSDDDIPF